MSVIQRMRERLNQIEKQRAELDAEAEKLHTALEVCADYDDSESGREPARKPLREIAIEVLGATGKPLHYQEIHKRAVAAGHHVDVGSLRRTLGKSPQFEQLGEGVYGLKR